MQVPETFKNDIQGNDTSLYPVIIFSIESDLDDRIENIIIEGTIFGFNGGYEDAEVLMPGKGYWLKANSNGIISLSYP